MRKRKWIFLSIMFILINSIFPIGYTANGTSTKNYPHNIYISPSEQNSLNKFLTESNTYFEELNLKVKKGQSKEFLTIFHNGYEQIIENLSPPISSVKITPYKKNNINGLWFTPSHVNSNKVLLYFHGGAYVFGSAKTSRGIVSYLTDKAKVMGLSIDYPLSPENPYPAALDYAINAYLDLLKQGFSPNNIVLAGDSAGGGLVLAVLLKLRDQNYPLPAGAYLISPWVDLTNNFESHKIKKSVDTALTEGFLKGSAQMYAAKYNLKTVYISPAFADLKQLPPLFIQVGSYEILLDDALTIARNAALANVPVQLKVWPGYYHDFQMFHEHLGSSRKALSEAASFFNQVLDKQFLHD